MLELQLLRLQFVTSHFRLVVSPPDEHSRGCESQMLVGRGGEAAIRIDVDVFRWVFIDGFRELHVIVVERALPEVSKGFSGSDGENARRNSRVAPECRQAIDERFRIFRDLVGACRTVTLLCLDLLGNAYVFRMLFAQIMLEVIYNVSPEWSARENAHSRSDPNLDRLG